MRDSLLIQIPGGVLPGISYFFNGVLVSWKSKLQKNVTLSSTEGEYVSTSHVSGEILFIYAILKDMGVNVELLIVVECDNEGEIYLSKNKTLGTRTKHIETRYHFVREYVEMGVLKIVYVKSEDNKADIMTKNTDKSTFWKHVDNFMDYSEVFGN